MLPKQYTINNVQYDTEQNLKHREDTHSNQKTNQTANVCQEAGCIVRQHFSDLSNLSRFKEDFDIDD